MYLVTYIINESGNDFLKRINEKPPRESFFEGTLCGEHIDLELPAEVTVFTIGIKYGWFVMSEEPKKRINEFELKILKKLQDFKYIYRVDESLIENYSLELDNEFWYNEEGAFDKFSLWIERQEELHWKKIFINEDIPASPSM
ncbi:MAG: hypothetical protein ACSHW7_00485 [Patiriisocius sp.]|uniref:hypothetical protein n=1 Tax=Patiriisocius sp. TaxID=2822396 RepID=UPI003EF86D39